MYRVILIFCTMFFSGCGGDNTTSSSIGNPESTASDIISQSVRVISGSWRGAYTHNDDDLLCEWNIQMLLENTHYENQIDSFYKGHVLATITNQNDDSNAYDCMTSGRLNIMWTASPAISGNSVSNDTYIVSMVEWGDDTADFGQNKAKIVTPYEITHNYITGSSDKLIYPRLSNNDSIITITR